MRQLLGKALPVYESGAFGKHFSGQRKYFKGQPQRSKNISPAGSDESTLQKGKYIRGQIGSAPE